MHGRQSCGYPGRLPCRTRPAVTAFRLALLTSWLLLSLLTLLGLSLQLRWWSGVGRGAHHVLYFLVTLGTGLAGWLALLGGLRWWPLILLLALLLGVSRTRPGQAAHWRLAGLIWGLYGGALWWLW